MLANSDDRDIVRQRLSELDAEILSLRRTAVLQGKNLTREFDALMQQRKELENRLQERPEQVSI